MHITFMWRTIIAPLIQGHTPRLSLRVQMTLIARGGIFQRAFFGVHHGVSVWGISIQELVGMNLPVRASIMKAREKFTEIEHFMAAI